MPIDWLLKYIDFAADPAVAPVFRGQIEWGYCGEEKYDDFEHKLKNLCSK